MKTTLLLFALLAGICCNRQAAAQKPHYEINGIIRTAENVKFILQKNSPQGMIRMDSAVVVNGRFKMMGGSVEFPELVMLTAAGKAGSAPFFLENSVITITGTLDTLNNVKITGSRSWDEMSEWSGSMRSLSARMMRLSDSLQNEMKNVSRKFVKEHPGSFVSPMAMDLLMRDMNPQELEEMISALAPEVQKSPVIAGMRTRMNAKLTVVPGKKAPDFTLNDVNGNPVSLSSKIGSKLLLVDFWAGWCGPCRQENPNVLKVYNEFKDQGFDIIGVSLDRTKDDWVKAIKDDKLPWTQVSDLSYFNSAAARLYNVMSIPANFLLDDKGVIVAVNLRGGALYNKIKGILAPETVSDIDGNVYHTVTIGKQVWMLENLKTTKYRNGDPIPNVKDSAGWTSLTTGAWCDYNNDPANSKAHGHLYNHFALTDSRNIAPEGWHVATDAEWATLVKNLGGLPTAGIRLNDAERSSWSIPVRATNETGFTARPGGFLNSNSHVFSQLGTVGNWYTATEQDQNNAWFYTTGQYGTMNRFSYSKKHGRSVRCIKD